MRKEVRIKDALSADLALRNRADSFFDDIEKMRASEIVIDFSEVRSISRSFAHEYQLRKKASDKKITEVHIPRHVLSMFNIVNSANVKSQVVSSDSAPLATI